MRTSNVTLTKEKASGLASINTATSTSSLAKTKYPFPCHTGVFAVAAKNYKPAMPENTSETLNDKGINLAY